MREQSFRFTTMSAIGKTSYFKVQENTIQYNTK